MSIDIAWDTFTTGPDGAELSEKIREFIDTKFQQIILPRFINSVHVHSFEFGSNPPDIEIKDVTDPLPDFYEEDEGTSDSDEQESNYVDETTSGSSIRHPASNATGVQSVDSLHGMSPIHEHTAYNPGSTSTRTQGGISVRPTAVDTQSLMFARSGTPGIPGGTSNLSYFHLPITSLSGAQTPLAALASGTPFSSGPWQHESAQQRGLTQSRGSGSHDQGRPSTSGSIPSPEIGSPFDPSSPVSRPVSLPSVEKVSDDLTLDDMSIAATMRDLPNNPADLQVIARVNYDGDVRMTLTAEILLDYPMPSFVSIPLRLAVTGMKFDGVAILAYIKKRMHFCFLDPDDAQTLVGDQVTTDQDGHIAQKNGDRATFGSLIREVQIQSEIGRQENGKQVLKNVGKVEKFVLEQVKKIFEDEFVFPSYWTFLV